MMSDVRMTKVRLDVSSSKLLYENLLSIDPLDVHREQPLARMTPIPTTHWVRATMYN